MSHELRTPLNAIIGFAELIRTETWARRHPHIRDYAKDIHDSGHHLLSLINDVLDLSKIEADRMVLDEETVDLNAVVATCIRMSRTQATRGGVSLVAEIDPNAALVRGEQRRLMQVVLNLISNAIKYTKQGGSVTIATRMRPDGSLELSVRDTGCGIAEQDLAIVMQPFGQIDNPYNRINQGTGLGLPLARRLVELHDGTAGAGKQGRGRHHGDRHAAGGPGDRSGGAGVDRLNRRSQAWPSRNSSTISTNRSGCSAWSQCPAPAMTSIRT